MCAHTDTHRLRWMALAINTGAGLIICGPMSNQPLAHRVAGVARANVAVAFYSPHPRSAFIPTETRCIRVPSFLRVPRFP